MLIDSVLVSIFLFSFSSIDGEVTFSLFLFIFSVVVCRSITGGSKKIDQPNKTIVESTMAINTFLKSIYFLPFLKLGTGSYPSFAPKALMG